MSQPPVEGVVASSASNSSQTMRFGAGAAMHHTPRRYEELEGIRGFAALLVIFYHLPYWHPAIHSFAIVDNGRLMVQLFFVLSGFVISNAYRYNIGTPRALLGFQLLRLGRLYPVHLLFLFFFLAIEFSKLYLARHYGITSSNSGVFRENNAIGFVEQLFLVQAMWPTGNGLSFNVPAWSISVEFYVYLLFGLIVLFLGRFFVFLSISIGAISIYLLGWTDSGEWNLVLRGLSGFFVGCLVQQFSTYNRSVGTPHLLLISVVAIAVFLCNTQTSTSECLIYPLSAAIIYACAVGPETALRCLLRSPPFAFLGRISYSVYMSHLAMIWIVNQMLRFSRVGSPVFVRAPNGHLDVAVSLPEALVACAAVVLLAVLVGTLVNRLVEEPCRAATRRWIAARK